MVDYVRYEL